jgi:hypothetical protein
MTRPGLTGVRRASQPNAFREVDRPIYGIGWRQWEWCEPTRCPPARNPSLDCAQVAGEHRVPDDHDRFGDECTRPRGRAQNSVPPQEVASRETCLEPLPGRAKAGSASAQVDGHRRRDRDRPPAGPPNPQSKIEILAIEPHTLVKAPDLLPRLTAVGSPSSARSGEDRVRRGRFGDGSAAKTRIRGERTVGAKPDTVDALATGLNEQTSGSPDGGVNEGLDEVLQKVRARLDVVVEEDDDLRAAMRRSPVARRSEADVIPEFDHSYLRKCTSHPIRCVVAGAVVDEDSRMGDGLLAKEAQALLGELPPVVRRNDDIDRRT